MSQNRKPVRRTTQSVGTIHSVEDGMKAIGISAARASNRRGFQPGYWPLGTGTALGPDVVTPAGLCNAGHNPKLKLSRRPTCAVE